MTALTAENQSEFEHVLNQVEAMESILDQAINDQTASLEGLGAVFNNIPEAMAKSFQKLAKALVEAAEYNMGRARIVMQRRVAERETLLHTAKSMRANYKAYLALPIKEREARAARAKALEDRVLEILQELDVKMAEKLYYHQELAVANVMYKRLNNLAHDIAHGAYRLARSSGASGTDHVLLNNIESYAFVSEESSRATKFSSDPNDSLLKTIRAHNHFCAGQLKPLGDRQALTKLIRSFLSYSDQQIINYSGIQRVAVEDIQQLLNALAAFRRLDLRDLSVEDLRTIRLSLTVLRSHISLAWNLCLAELRVYETVKRGVTAINALSIAYLK